MRSFLIFSCVSLLLFTNACVFRWSPSLRKNKTPDVEAVRNADKTEGTAVSVSQTEDNARTQAADSERPEAEAVATETEEKASGSEETQGAAKLQEDLAVREDLALQEDLALREESKADPPEKEEAAEDANSYKIGNGDILEIVTWKEPDFTKEIMVRLDGKITFPLLDDITVAGLTPLEVKAEIENGLKEYVTAPIVTVSVKAAESQKFYILGEISKTGEYKLVKDLTVLQAFALAGGFTEWASKKEIILIRHEEGEEKIIRVNYKNIARGRDFSQNIFIQANDTIIVP